MGKKSRLKKLRRASMGSPMSGLPGSTELIDRVRRENGPVILARSLEGQEKMSVVLEEFAAPLLDHAHTSEEVHKAVGMAAVAWNYALLSPEERETTKLNNWILQCPEMAEIVEVFVMRKAELFPNNRRAILDFELVPKPGSCSSCSLNVISTLT